MQPLVEDDVGRHGEPLVEQRGVVARVEEVGELDPAVAAIVAACDGDRTLGAVLTAAATSAESSLAELTEAALPIVRRLVERAFLLPVTA